MDGESNAKPQPSKKKKKRKRNAASDDGDESDADIALLCEHCGGVVPEVSLRVASLDGTTLELTVPQRGLVREVKRAVGQVRRERDVACRCCREAMCCPTHRTALRLWGHCHTTDHCFCFL